MTKILVVEDDERTAAEILAALADHGFVADHAANGRDALARAATGKYGAIVLDRMLPGGLDGLGVLKALRTTRIDVPVLILSAISAVGERVDGLRAGGDDYLTKPFEFIELIARIEALLRRPPSNSAETVLVVGDLRLDLLSRSVQRAGRSIELLPREFAVLEYFVRNVDLVVTRSMIFEHIWGYRYDERTNVIDVHIARLRRKLEEVAVAQMIHTVRGTGYVLSAAH